MLSKRLLSRVILWIEWVILSIATLCIVSYLIATILDGVIQYLSFLVGEPTWNSNPTVANITATNISAMANVTLDTIGVIVPGSRIESIATFLYAQLTMMIWVIYTLLNKTKSGLEGIHQLTGLVMGRLRDGIFVALIEYLYLKGPSWNGFGFWKGKRRQDICTQLKGSDATFWTNNIDECNKAIDAEVQSLVVGAQALIVVILIIKYFGHLRSMIVDKAKSLTPPSSPGKLQVKSK